MRPRAAPLASTPQRSVRPEQPLATMAGMIGVVSRFTEECDGFRNPAPGRRSPCAWGVPWVVGDGCAGSKDDVLLPGIYFMTCAPAVSAASIIVVSSAARRIDAAMAPVDVAGKVVNGSFGCSRKHHTSGIGNRVRTPERHRKTEIGRTWTAAHGRCSWPARSVMGRDREGCWMRSPADWLSHDGSDMEQTRSASRSHFSEVGMLLAR